MPTGGLGPDGVQRIYPDKAGGTQFYLNQDDPYKDGGGPGTTDSRGQFNISYGSGSHFPFMKKNEGGLTFFNTTGSPITYASGSAPGRSVRLDIYPDGGKFANQTTYSWKSNPGYLYTDKGIKNGEFTTFIRTHGDLGTHQSYAHKLGGREDDSIRSLIEMVYPTATHSDVQVNYNYAHFPYINAKPTIVKAPTKIVAEKWVGVKTIHFVAADGKSSHWEMWYDEDPFDASGKPANHWTLGATFEDHGTSGYGNVPLTWACHKDVCRVDGFASVDFTLLSDREIDPSVKPSGTP